MRNLSFDCAIGNCLCKSVQKRCHATSFIKSAIIISSCHFVSSGESHGYTSVTAIESVRNLTTFTESATLLWISRAHRFVLFIITFPSIFSYATPVGFIIFVRTLAITPFVRSALEHGHALTALRSERTILLRRASRSWR